MYHITEHNAGLIIRRLESSYCFETFELSPTNRAAMTTKGRLIRELPATATEVSTKYLNDCSFQEVLTKTLVKMSHQAVAEMQRKVKKAQQIPFEEHTDFSLRELDTFLSTIPRRKQLSTTKEFKAKPITLALDPLTLPTVNGSVNNDKKSFELAAVETWVQNNLGTWLEHHLSNDSAEKWYTGRPKRLSKMLLTLGEIWVAIDKMAVHHNPLMLKYKNEIPREVFSDLLLHSKTDMERLYWLGEYLEDTSGELKLSALLAYGQRLSFAVEYFRQWPKLQEMKEKIERSAQLDRDKRLKQFRELKAKYDAIMKQYDGMQCEKVLEVQHDLEYYVHTKHKCRRCALPAKAKKPRISPHEWPLPAGELEAQTSVFEMDVPVTFAVWRDATVYFLDNILRFESSCAGGYPRAQGLEHRPQRTELLEAAVHIALVCIETFNLKAIKRRCPDFAREGKWSMVSGHWVTETTGNLQVHVSLLTGQLLVNGSPVSRLSQKYETQREYQKLFGSTTMEVMPSNLPGMSFCATKKFHAYTVHLGMQTKKGVDDLLVRLSKNGSTWYLLPSRYLQDLLPDDFSDNHVHWLEEASGEIEFCHVDDPWPSMNTDSWHLRQDIDTWKLSLGKEIVLVCPSTCLGLTFCSPQKSKELEARLPELCLEFTIRSGTSNIKSRQFRDMAIDQNQAIWTLIGLENKLIQEVKGLIAKFGPEIKSKYPHSIEFDARHVGRYPRLRILRLDAETEIFNRVTEAVCDTGMAGLPIARQPRRIRDALQRYISQPEPMASDIEVVEISSLWNEMTSRSILLLRGLFAGGILSFTLGRKQWRVNYGVDHNREKMAKLVVPFRAKDYPTPRSEFSQPDVVITLTCLSYYYSGPDDDALFAAFELLSRSDNPTQEYQDWIKTAPSLPQAFKNLEGVNLRDRVQCTTEIFPHARYSKAAVDYYLCHLVFAKESKEFPYKLGTNDSRYVLPLSVKQLDLPEQKHTNALVLEYLLQPENGISLMPQEAKGTTFDSSLLLQMVSNMSSSTRIIVDVSTQVVDLTNQEFAMQWLACYQDHSSTQAVVFFNDNDDIVIIDRSGKIEDFQTSPFSQQLDPYLVFLDKTHTRRTDLKLSANYRAMVTLGAGLTKDRLVQACMRMRKLGKGQTVEFCIPWEIEHKIFQLKDGGKEEISLSDVLCLAITETCLDLKRAMPLWLTQGARFSKQEAIWPRLSDNDTKPDEFLEEEVQSLREGYCPRKGLADLSSLTERLNDSITKVFKSRCEDFGLERLRTCSLQEEQERELTPETQHERQVEKVPALKPDTHKESEHVTLHLYAPRVNIGFGLLDDLQLYSVRKKVVEEIPRDIITFLNLFAGQLYPSSHDDYKLVCDLLGLAWDAAEDGAAGGSQSQCDFMKSPAAFLKELSEKVRQDCGTIDKTDMGRVIEGVRLVEGDFNSRHGFYIKNLEDRVAELELALRNQGIDTESIVNRSSQDALESTPEAHSSDYLNLLRLLVPRPNDVQYPQDSAYHTLLDTITVPDTIKFPPRPRAIQLTATYFEHTNFFSRVLNQKSFHDIIAILYQDQTHRHQTSQQDGLFCSNDCIRIVLRVSYWNTHRKAASYDLEHLQNLLLIVQYTIFASNLSAAWHFIGLVTRLAIDLELLNETRLSVIDNADVPPLDPTSKLAPHNFFDGALHMILVSLFSPSRRFPHLSEDELRGLAQYASMSIELYSEGFKEGKLRFYWRTTPNLFQSGAALIHCIKILTLLGAVFDVNALKSRVSVCSTVLWGMAERYPPGALYCDRFEEMSATIDELASDVPMGISSDFLFGHHVLPWLDSDGAATLWTSTSPTLDPWILDQR
ncbi:hypothetical protein FMEXI_6178 [Fusarium mexicanum]|uniref:ubiquitinyl hydrolase 1 n=1 Tax=Fusarium mexicanum TaxID=751941 RepID=A0A8H5IZE2_9HYPO|nr:hypothetical protein FMEXI_6178 [Fusarium mexicanum]